MLLSDETFLNIIKNTPLVSIDILVKNNKNEILLGMRTNEPAKGFYFTPGGRIKKNEAIRNAFSRIMKTEININSSIDSAKFIGIFDHIYPTNKFERTGISTHYVAAGYIVEISEEEKIQADCQHSHFRWFDCINALRHPDVHENTKIYIQKATNDY